MPRPQTTRLLTTEETRAESVRELKNSLIAHINYNVKSAIENGDTKCVIKPNFWHETPLSKPLAKVALGCSMAELNDNFKSVEVIYTKKGKIKSLTLTW